MNDNKSIPKIKNKKIFIVNGYPKSGKTTFGKILNSYIPTKHISIVDSIKNLESVISNNTNVKSPKNKNEKYRKFLSDLKDLCEDYNDYPFQKIINEVFNFLFFEKELILLIDMRSPEDITRAINTFNAKTIFIKNSKGEKISSNHADADVEKIEYMYIIDNNGSLDDFKDEIKKFLVKIMVEESPNEIS